MAVNAGQQPDKCPNPDCGSEGDFSIKGIQFVYDKRGQLGTAQVEQIPRARVTTWQCDRCHSLIEVWSDL